MIQFPKWQGPYLEVLTENDPDKFQLKVSNALIAISRRLTTFETISPEEKRALDTALKTLRRLQEGEQSDTGAA
jgi:hypothetical protein